MMRAPTPPTIPYYSLFQEEPFKIRPSPPRQLLRGILVSKPCGHSKSTIVSNRTKTVSINVDQLWSVRVPPGFTQQPLFRFNRRMEIVAKNHRRPRALV